MKKFVYEVAGYEFVGETAWGEAWKQAKAKATELHAAIYRTVIEGRNPGTRSTALLVCSSPLGTLRPRT